MRNPPRLLQLLLSNAATPRSFRCEESGDEATIYLYDVIDDYWGISAQSFVQQLAGLTAKTVHLRINSPGGDVFAARAMATAVRGYHGKVISHIDGVAASAATYVALAAAEVEMTQGAFFMVHKAWALAIGNSDELLELAALLEKVDDSIAHDYQRKTKKARDKIDAWMKAETWFNADEAKAEGFVDRVVDGDPVDDRWDLAAYERAPEASKRKPAPAMDDQVAAARATSERRLKFLHRVPA
jgi:ATP-dependent Clp protease protease subunit